MRILYTDSDFGSSAVKEAHRRVSLLELKLGANVKIALDLTELRTLAKKRRYDLIILDVLLRPSKLFELYRQLKKHADDVVIVSDNYRLISDAAALKLRAVDKLDFERFVDEEAGKVKRELELN